MNNSLIERMRNENYRLVSIDLFSGPGGRCQISVRVLK